MKCERDFLHTCFFFSLATNESNLSLADRVTQHSMAQYDSCTSKYVNVKFRFETRTLSWGGGVRQAGAANMFWHFCASKRANEVSNCTIKHTCTKNSNKTSTSSLFFFCSS